jgi:hypothetical protein
MSGLGAVLAVAFVAHAGSLDGYARDSGLHRPRPPDSRPSPETPAVSGVISSGRTAITVGYGGSSACPPPGGVHAWPTSRACYDKKRAEGKTHRHAAARLARRRIDVLWAPSATTRPTSRPND